VLNKMVEESKSSAATEALGDSGSLLSLIRDSTAIAYESQTTVRIDSAALEAAAASVDSKMLKKATRRVPYPLQFDSPAAEINFHCIYHLLRFGGSYEPDLVRRTQTTLLDTITFGMIGSHISRVRLDAPYMREVGIGDIAATFKIPVREMEESSTIPGVTVERPGVLAGLAGAMQSALNTAGERLQQLGYPDMTQLIMDTVRNDSTAERLVTALAGALSHSFDDKCSVTAADGTSVTAVQHKNAQLLAAELHYRMQKKVPALALTDIDSLSAVADADTITGLLCLGILKPTKEAAAGAAADGSAFTAADTAALRVAACVACHQLAEQLPEASPMDAAAYAAYISRIEQYKDFVRFVPEVSRAL
jgi:hypothetical protein